MKKLSLLLLMILLMSTFMVGCGKNEPVSVELVETVDDEVLDVEPVEETEVEVIVSVEEDADDSHNLDEELYFMVFSSLETDKGLEKFSAKVNTEDFAITLETSIANLEVINGEQVGKALKSLSQMPNYTINQTSVGGKDIQYMIWVDESNVIRLIVSNNTYYSIPEEDGTVLLELLRVLFKEAEL